MFVKNPMIRTKIRAACPGARSVAAVFRLLFAGAFGASAQDAVPGVLSGVGTDASRVQGAALNRSVAPADESGTPRVAPPDASAVPDSDPGPFRALRAVRLLGDIGFAEARGLQAKIESVLLNGENHSLISADAALSGIRGELIGAGYYLATLSVPQDAYDEDAGALAVRVGAGYAGDVSVVFPERDGGDGRWFSKDQIGRRFSDFTTNEVFNYRTLHRRLSDINGHPDLTLDTHIQVRSAVEGEGDARRVERYADLNLTAKESFPFHAMLEINNHATKELDDWQAQLTLQYLNLTRADDVLTLSHGITLNGELRSFSASYMRPHHLGKGGATTVYGGYSDLGSENVVPRINLDGAGRFAGFAESFNLVDTEGSLLSLSAGILYRRIEDRFSADIYDQSVTIQERDVSVLPLTVSLSYSTRKPDALRGRNFATLSGICNLRAGGDDDLGLMWLGAKEHYAIARLQLARLQTLFAGRDETLNPARRWTLLLKADGQWSPDPLIPAEKLFLGGCHTVRGYTSKCALGDSGIYGSAELRTPILLDPLTRLFRGKGQSPLDRWQALVFVDAGYAALQDALPGSVDGETMLSVGVGLRLAVTPHSQFRLDYGIPLLDIDADDHSKSGAFYFSGQLQF